MPIFGGGSSGASTPMGVLSLMAGNPDGAPGGYVAGGYATISKVMPAYTPNVQNVAYSGGLLNLLLAAKLDDLNTLRVAVENQRVLAEANAQLINAIKADLISAGLIKQ